MLTDLLLHFLFSECAIIMRTAAHVTWNSPGKTERVDWKQSRQIIFRENTKKKKGKLVCINTRFARYTKEIEKIIIYYILYIIHSSSVWLAGAVYNI